MIKVFEKSISFGYCFSFISLHRLNTYINKEPDRTRFNNDLEIWIGSKFNCRFEYLHRVQNPIKKTETGSATLIQRRRTILHLLY